MLTLARFVQVKFAFLCPYMGIVTKTGHDVDA